MEKVELKENKFEAILDKDNFYENFADFDEANKFKEFLVDKYNTLLVKEAEAESNYNSNSKLKEYVDLINQSNAIDKFMFDELEYGTEEWNKKEKEMEELQKKAEAILENNAELKKLEKELADKSFAATKEKEKFLKENKVREKIEVINKLLKPLFERVDQVEYLSNKRGEELRIERNRLYNDLENYSGDNEKMEETEANIRKTEREIERLPFNIKSETEILERMKVKLPRLVNDIYNEISL